MLAGTSCQNIQVSDKKRHLTVYQLSTSRTQCLSRLCLCLLRLATYLSAFPTKELSWAGHIGGRDESGRQKKKNFFKATQRGAERRGCTGHDFLLWLAPDRGDHFGAFFRWCDPQRALCFFECFLFTIFVWEVLLWPLFSCPLADLLIVDETIVKTAGKSNLTRRSLGNWGKTRMTCRSLLFTLTFIYAIYSQCNRFANKIACVLCFIVSFCQLQ